MSLPIAASRPRRDQEERPRGGVYQIYTDGASFNNGKKKANLPCYAAWAAVLAVDGRRFGKATGAREGWTNNQAELSAVIDGVRELLDHDLEDGLRRLGASPGEGRPIWVEVISDSQYVVNSINNSLEIWKQAGWQNEKQGTPVANARLWDQLYRLLCSTEGILFSFKWVRGHQSEHASADARLNNWADALARDTLADAFFGGVPPDGRARAVETLERRLRQRGGRDRSYVNEAKGRRKKR